MNDKRQCTTIARLVVAALAALVMMMTVTMMVQSEARAGADVWHHRDTPPVIHLVMSADGRRWPHALPTINSVLLNTRAAVTLYAVTDAPSATRTEVLLKRAFPKLPITVRVLTEELLSKDKIKIRGNRQTLANPMNYARYFIPDLFPEIESRFIYLDDDVIVQGDILELWEVDMLSRGIAVSTDCSDTAQQYNMFQNTYDMFINFNSPHIQALNMDPKACSFNAGVFVGDAAVWRQDSTTQQLVAWLELNTRENVYGGQGAGGGSQPPMLITFYNKYASLPDLWHIRGLGSNTGKHLPRELLERAQLLHWTGRNKPWMAEAFGEFVSFYDHYKLNP
ncbi:hypothetical protein PTSG_03339 [Salpingoeca rosetta]|uniref:Hexosyltransferase n=1 Tax=Salpingoeca rosetta (strain ATCC 50818 / BSB-021) TaxID=946362 RepID=F2U4W2_SALR5|nr:uncharacterized protein PTSG_03339 [Salpingoeca rosetta]EGD82678.1 hypothetical protein PTSG_03339 [Salpingoeca rosetta]|eukprot:XP_004995914.1 hypothetical protein PTSG_03339 [Salpingoeca rosetta]